MAAGLAADAMAAILSLVISGRGIHSPIHSPMDLRRVLNDPADHPNPQEMENGS